MGEQSADPEPNKHSNWLKRLLQRMGGDLIAGQVGEGARNVIIGKNIIQIGAILIPTYLIVILGVFVLFLVIIGIVNLVNIGKTAQRSAEAVAILSFTATPTPVPTFTSTPIPMSTATPLRMPEGAFNIAIAELEIIGLNGNSVIDPAMRQQAHARAAEISRYFQGQAQTLGASLHRSVEIWGPDRYPIPVVANEEGAVLVATQLNATVLLYGNFAIERANRWQFSPQFYINHQVADHAKELVGPYALGSQIPYDADDFFSPSELNDAMRSRLETLMQILLAVGALYDDPPRYNHAAKMLDTFLEQSDWAQERDGGQEILYFFLGRARLGEAHRATDRTLMMSYLDQALAAFDQAIVLNSNYARAYNGRGSVYYERALRIPRAGCGVEGQALFNAAEQDFRQALHIDLVYKAPTARVDYFANYGLAIIDTERGYCATRASDLQAAIRQHQQATESYQSVLHEYATIQQPPEAQTHIAIFAQGGLARIKITKACSLNTEPEAALPAAIAHYATAISMIDTAESRLSQEYGVQIMPEYLAALCKTDQPEQALIVLDAFLADLSATHHFTDIIAIQQSIQTNVYLCRTSWKGCTYAVTTTPKSTK